MKTAFKILGTFFAIGMAAALPIAGFYVHSSLGWLMVAVSCYACGQACYTVSDEMTKQESDKCNKNTSK